MKVIVQNGAVGQDARFRLNQGINEWINHLIKNQSEFTRLKSVSCTKLHHRKINDRTVNEVMSEAMCNRKGVCWQVMSEAMCNRKCVCWQVMSEAMCNRKCVCVGRLWVRLCATGRLCVGRSEGCCNKISTIICGNAEGTYLSVRRHCSSRWQKWDQERSSI
jgi:hypothetical protein